MSTSSARSATSAGGGATYAEVQASEEFQGLKRTLRRFVFPATVVFLAWYLLYILLTVYARDFMAQQVLGNINVAYLLGPAAVRVHLRHRVRLLAVRGQERRPDRGRDPPPPRGDPAVNVLAQAADAVEGGQRALTISLFLAFVLLTLVITVRASRNNATAADFYSGGRSLTGPQNGVAIGGDYMSAASLPRHRRHHRAVGLRRVPLLHRLPRRVAGRAAARGRAAAQQRQVHDGRRPRVPDEAAPGARRRRHLHDHRLDLLPARADGRRRRARHAAARRHQRHGQEHHDRRRRRADDLLRHGRRHEGHDLGADHQGRPAHDGHDARDDPGHDQVRRQRQRAARRRRRQERQGRGVPRAPAASTRPTPRASRASSTCSASASRWCSARPACRTSSRASTRCRTRRRPGSRCSGRSASSARST